MKLSLTLKKSDSHRYTSRERGKNGEWVYHYGNSSGPIGKTSSGKDIHASESGAYDAVHDASLRRQGEAVKEQFPHYSAQDHLDAAAAHKKHKGPSAGRYHYLMAQAHEEAAQTKKKSVIKSEAHAYISRERGKGGEWIYHYDTSRGKVGQTASGSPVFGSESHVYQKIDKLPADKRADYVKSTLPDYTKQEHLDAAKVHSEHAVSGLGRNHSIVAAAHREAAKTMDKSMRRATSMKSERKNISLVAKSEADAPASSDVSRVTEGRGEDGLELLQQMLSQWENANFGGVSSTPMSMATDGEKALEDAESKSKQEAASVAQEPKDVDTRGNAPHLPYKQATASDAAKVDEVAEMKEPVEKSERSVPMAISYDQIAHQSALLSYFASHKPAPSTFVADRVL